MTGKTDQAKGHVKQAIGEVTGNKKLTAEGKVDVTAGKAKEVIEEASKKIKDIRK